MKTWEHWYPHVLVHAPGAPNPFVDLALREAAREFFRRTKAWVEWLDPVIAPTNPSPAYEYDFELPCDSTIVVLMQATNNGNPLCIDNYRMLPKDPARYANSSASIASSDMETFTLSGGFSHGDKIQAQVSLMPAPTSKGLPDHLANRFITPLVEGAKAQLLAIAGTDFFNPSIAAASRMAFERSIGEHGHEAYTGNTGAVPRMNRRNWF